MTLDWFWRLFNGFGKIPTQPQVLDSPKVDDQVGKKVVRDRGAVSTKKSNTSPKSSGVRSNNTGKTSRKSTGAAIRAAAAKGKAKSKAVQKD